MRWLRIMFSLAILAALGGCDLPKDPQNTLNSVRGGTLDVGVLGGTLPDADRTELESLAAALSAELVPHQGEPHRLVESVKSGDLDLLAGGLPSDSPFAADLGLSNPFGTIEIGDKSHDRVFGIRKGENAFLLFINRHLAESSS